LDARIPGGAIIIARRIIDSEIMKKPPLYMKVWIYLLARAQHKDYKQLKRGQLITSIPEIREACSWYVGARKVKPTEREVRSVLDWMRGKSKTVSSVSRNPNEQSSSVSPNVAMISSSKVTHGLLITIENYSVYQSLDNYERRTETKDERQGEKSSNVAGATEYKQECNKNENKYNPRKRAKRIYDDDSPYMKMAIYFKDRVLSWKPNAKVPNDLNRWADDFRKLHELDKRTKQEIKDVIDWATSDSFWQANILSPGKLRKQFDTLQAQMNRKVIKMPEKPMSYWEEKQRREEELERKRLAERDKQMKVQRFIEVTGLHPMKHKDLLRDYLEGRVTLSELKKRRWGS
jgi:hypothetical protein